MGFLNQELPLSSSLTGVSQTKSQGTVTAHFSPFKHKCGLRCSPQKLLGWICIAYLWICIAEVAKELLLGQSSVHTQLPSLIQAHEM